MKQWFFEVYMRICSWSIWHWRIRRILYGVSGISISKNSSIHSGCFLSGNKFILGEHSYVNRNCSFDCNNASIKIGNYVGIAFDVRMYTTNHDYSCSKKRTGVVTGNEIIIRDGAWIGGGVIICPGVTIGYGCVVAAGSVVIHDCLDNCLYAGNPARKIKELDVEKDSN